MHIVYFGENLSAFLIRFTKTCLKRILSPNNYLGNWLELNFIALIRDGWVNDYATCKVSGEPCS